MAPYISIIVVYATILGAVLSCRVEYILAEAVTLLGWFQRHPNNYKQPLCLQCDYSLPRAVRRFILDVGLGLGIRAW
jgi:hypothetical protein